MLTTRSDLFLTDILSYFYSIRLFLLLRLGRGFVLVAILYLSFVLKRIEYRRLFLYSSVAFVYSLGFGFGSSFSVSVRLSIGFNLDIDIDINICRYTNLISDLGLP